MTDEELEKKYPLMVKYGGVGEHHILNWWTEWERNHIILAKSVDQLDHLYGVLQSTPKLEHPEPRGYYKVVMGSPPKWARTSFARAALKDHIRSVQHYVGGMLQRYEEDHKSLPAKIKRCKRRLRNKYGGTSKAEAHYSCEQCFFSFVVDGKTVEQVFEEQKGSPEDWFCEHLSRGMQLPKGPELEPDPFQIVTNNLGSGGISNLLRNVTLGGEEGISPFSEVLFFCKGEKLPIPESIQRRFDLAEAKNKRELELRDLENKKHAGERKKSDKEKIEQFIERL